MQPKIWEASMLVAYGTAINQALANARTKLEDLKVLRDHAVSVLAAQGDLKGSLGKLEKEIKSRERALKAKAKKK
jgi:soluble P-type ATPase